MQRGKMAPNTSDSTRRFLTRRHGKLGSWHILAQHLGGANRGLLSAVASGHRKPTKVLRIAVQRLKDLENDYPTWRARNLPALERIVAWAETPRAERVWPPDRSCPRPAIYSRMTICCSSLFSP